MCWEMCYEILDYELKIYQIKTSPPLPLAPPLLWCAWAKLSKENLLLKRNIIDTWSFLLGLTTSLEQIYLKLYLVYYLLNSYLMFFFFQGFTPGGTVQDQESVYWPAELVQLWIDAETSDESFGFHDGNDFFIASSHHIDTKVFPPLWS